MGFKKFRYCIKEKDIPCIKFEILAETPHKFHVRMPQYDYIKEEPRLSVEYDREQLILFLLAYDEKQCLEFMEKLYANMGSATEYIDKLRQNPAFAMCQKSQYDET